MRESNETTVSCRRGEVLLFLFFGSVGEKCVSEIVRNEVGPNVESIIQVVNNYLEEHEDEDVFYSFHKFEEIVD